MMWLFRRKKTCNELLEAKAAKIEAQMDLDTAKQKYRDVSQQTAELDQINKRNHFSESLTRAFRKEAPS